MISSKKATAWILVLVIVTLVLCASCLFIFNISENRAEERISSASFIEDFYGEQEIQESYIYSLARDIVYKNKSINPSDFILEFKGRYLKNAPAEYLTEGYKKQIQENTYNVRIEERKLYFQLQGFEFVKRNPGEYIGFVSNTQDLEFEIDF